MCPCHDNVSFCLRNSVPTVKRLKHRGFETMFHRNKWGKHRNLMTLDLLSINSDWWMKKRTPNITIFSPNSLQPLLISHIRSTSYTFIVEPVKLFALEYSLFSCGYLRCKRMGLYDMSRSSQYIGRFQSKSTWRLLTFRIRIKKQKQRVVRKPPYTDKGKSVP